MTPFTVAPSCCSGSDASSNSIAKAAGVGPGTSYRRFPNRESLVLAVYRRDVQRLVDAAPGLLAEHEPLEGVRVWFERLTRYLRLKHGLGAATKQAMTEENTGPVKAAVEVLLEAGQADGTITGAYCPATW